MSRFAGLTITLALALSVGSACGSKTGLLEPGGAAERDSGVDAAIDAPIDAPRDVAIDGVCVASPEVCNGDDDDCDGVEDDGIGCFFVDGRPLQPVQASGCGASWYSYDFPDSQSANPMPDIRRSDQVVLAVNYQPSCGAYLAVIADLPQDGSGGQLDGTFVSAPASGVGLVVADEPGECAQSGSTIACSWVWQPCCTDGALIGPLANDGCVEVRLDNAAGVSGLAVLDGSETIAYPLPTTLQLCSTLKPAVD